jgi:hypothetical protein
MKNQLVFIATIDPDDIKTEDGGSAKIATLVPDNSDDPDNGIFIRVHSWREYDQDHTDFNALIKPGKRYIVHIEQVEDSPPPFKKES